MKLELANMAEEAKNYLYSLLNRIDGLLAIVITDRDGIPVLKVATEQTPELVLRPNYLSAFATASDQAGKMGMNKNKSMVCIYDSYQVVQINKSSLLITFIASSEANTGCLLDLPNGMLKEMIQDLQRVVT